MALHMLYIAYNFCLGIMYYVKVFVILLFPGTDHQQHVGNILFWLSHNMYAKGTFQRGSGGPVHTF